jgi:threonylcarbamoyladenosine tRNA methylthiotransferase MtaB
MSLDIITFGCRLNIYESSVIKQHAQKAGLKDAIIFNSCAVTEEAEKKLQQAIRKAKRTQPHKKILVTGCAAQIAPKKYAALADAVFGNDEKLHLQTYKELQNNHTKLLVSDIMSVKKTTHHVIDGIESKTRAFLQIQNGCNHRCTFCVIPYGRGNSRSVPVGEIVRSAKQLVSQGYRELVLTGVDMTSYGSDLPGQPSLGNMISRMLQMVPEILRLRLSSVDVAEVDDELLEVITSNQRFMPYLHLSLQSGNNMILKRMKRRHNREQTINFCQDVLSKRAEMVFGADIIAGFPTETEDMFLDSFKLIEELNIMHLHVFPYSARNNTPAARMPQVNPEVITRRAKELRTLQNGLLHEHLKKKIGNNQSILIETDGRGLTEDYCKVQTTLKIIPGEVRELRVKSVVDNKLLVE